MLYWVYVKPLKSVRLFFRLLWTKIVDSSALEIENEHFGGFISEEIVEIPMNNVHVMHPPFLSVTGFNPVDPSNQCYKRMYFNALYFSPENVEQK
jgi:hypothetical protein